MFAHGSGAMTRAPRNRRVPVSKLAGSIGLAGLALVCLSAVTPSAWGTPGPTAETASAEGARCAPPAWARNQSSRISATVTVFKPEIEIGFDSAAANGTARTFHSASGDAGRAQPEVELYTENEYGAAPQGGRTCFWVRAVHARVKVRLAGVTVAPRHGPKSCMHQAATDHTEKHVQAAGRAAGKFITSIQSALQSTLIPSPKAPVVVQSEPQAKRKAEADIKSLLEPLERKIADAVARAEAVLDSPDKYTAILARCGES